MSKGLSKALGRVLGKHTAARVPIKVDYGSDQIKEGAKVIFDLALAHPNGVVYETVREEMRDLGYSFQEIVGSLYHARAVGLVTLLPNWVIVVNL